MAPRKSFLSAGTSSGIILAAFTGAASAQECGSASYAWCSGYPYYYSENSLPVVDGTSCCGSELLGDPTVGDEGRTCLCDLTAGACDEGCCCDTDCSSDSLRFDGIFGCTSNGTARTQQGFTVCNENLVATNIPAYAQEQGLATALGGADGLLCVFSDNSPARGAYFRDPVSATALTPQAVISQMDAAKPLQYGTTWLTTPPSIPEAFYSLDEPLLGDGCVASTDATGCSRRAPVSLPAVDASGACGGQQQLGYLRDVAPYSCPLLPAGMPTTASSRRESLRLLCGGVLNSTSAQLTRATFAAAPSTAAADLPMGLMVRTLVNGSGTYAAATGALPPSSFGEGSNGGTCFGALTSLELKLTVTGAGTLSYATAYVTLADVAAGSLPTFAPTYAAAFVYAAADEEAAPSTTVVRPTSGRPGYVRGKPLLIAEGTSVRTGGLDLLPRSPTGVCGTGLGGGAKPVLFGEDLAVSCTLTMPTASLASMCAAGTTLAGQSPYTNLNMTDGVTKLGVYGDSHPSIAADWVPLTVRFPQNEPDSAMVWDASTGTCSNVLTGLHLRVLYANVGSVAVPVSKIVGAELMLSSRSVSASKGALGHAGPDSTTLTVTSTTTFAKLDADTFEFIPESPQLIPPLPYDFFYPFTVSYA